MQSAVETLSPTRVRLTVDVPFSELGPELDSAYKKIGRQVKVQGFRPGKVPPRILDQRVGRGVVLEEAVQEALPRLYSEAVTEAGVSPVGRPEVDVTKLDDGNELTFTAEVDVRPEFEIPAYDSLKVEVAPATVADEDVDTQIDELRERFASLAPVERAAAEGDFLTLDLHATVDGEDVPGGTATGLSYKVGGDELLEGLDAAVTGKSAGDATTFTTTLVAGDYEGQAAEVAVTVQAVNERTAPAGRRLLRRHHRLRGLRRAARRRPHPPGARAASSSRASRPATRSSRCCWRRSRSRCPSRSSRPRSQWRRQATQQQLQQAGMTLEQYLESEGKGEEEFDEELETAAADAVKAQLVLDAVADKEELGVTDAELTDQVVRRAQRAGVSPDQYAQSVVQSGQLQGLVAEVRRGKALATVMEAAGIADTDGATVDLDELRDDLSPADDTQLDEDGRPFHTHADGTVHYLDEG